MLGLPQLAQRNDTAIWRNPLAFPAGRKPGFNASHFAAIGCRFMAVANGTSYINILTGTAGTPSGTPTPSSGMYGAIGPTVTFGSAHGQTSVVTVPGMAAVAEPIVTIAGFIVLSVTGNFFQFLLTNDNGTGSGSGTAFGTAATGQLTFLYNNTGRQLTASSVVLQTNVPYFIAGSVNWAGSTGNFVSVNLNTGQIKSQTVSGATSATAAGNGTYCIGNFSAGTQTNNLTGMAAAVMCSRAFLSLSQLLAWAQDPWSFWYPEQPNFDYTGAAAVGGNRHNFILTRPPGLRGVP